MLNNFDFNFDDKKKKKKNNQNNNYNNIIQTSNGGDDYNQNNNEDENFCSLIFKRLKIWFHSITFIVKTIIVISLFFWVLDLVTIGYMTYCFANIPYFTIGYFQIWRLITGNLITTGFLSLLFAVIFWVSDGIIIEKQEGSTKYFIYFLIHTIIIQIIYDFLYFIFNGISQKPTYIYSSGLWSYIICEVTINCLISPNTDIYLLCVPYSIKAKYFPILILVIFIIFGGFELGLFVGVGYGFLYGFFFQNYLIISSETLIKIESILFNCVLNFKGFIKITETKKSMQQPFIGNFTQNNNNYNNENESDSNSEDSNSNNFHNKLKKFTPFMGKGITLGTDKGH